MLIALAVRLVAWRAQPFITVDGSEYVRFAEALRAGHGFSSIAPPGYPALIAIARLVVHDRVASAALVSIVCGALLPWPVWSIARRAVGDRIALLPALVVAIHPEIARYSAVAMSESAFLLAFYTALAAVPVSAAGSGLLLGAAYLIRPEALVAAGVLALRGVWRMARGHTSRRALALGAAGFLALALPCMAWYRATTGEWTLSPKLVNVQAMASDWREAEPRIIGAETPAAHPALGERLRSAAGNLPSHARSYAGWLLDLWPWPLAVLTLIGLASGVGIQTVPLAHLAVLAGYGAAAQRFLLPVLPALGLTAAIGAARLKRRFRLAAAGFAFAGVVLLWFKSAATFHEPLDGHIDAPVEAGRWLREHSAPGEPVVDRKPYVAFYAERPYLVMPEASYDSLLSWAVARRARWLVVDQGVASVFRRQLLPLIYDDAFRDHEARVELAYVGGRVPGYGVGLFRVLQPDEPKSTLPPALEAGWVPPR